LAHSNKTKVICTIGPASDSPQVLEQLISAGMNIARLNFSHGDFSVHAETIRRIREAARLSGRRIGIMADLPGPKIRIGRFAQEPVDLRPGDRFTLTTEDITGNPERVSVTFSGLHQAVKPGDRLYLNDGIIELRVERISGRKVLCEVMVGGTLLSKKGLNLPGIDLGISAFTDHDFRCLKFALEHGVDAVSQSFVENAADIEAVRSAASDLGFNPFIIAKIERAGALKNIDAILDAADGIMVARGDLGVEIPIEEIALVQKQLMKKANRKAKPVITATQMLESMTTNRRPTRAEATDVANAILDGTDCVMLSGESAMGRYPVEAVSMLAKIASAVEPSIRWSGNIETPDQPVMEHRLDLPDLIALSVRTTVERITPAAAVVPTRSGATARRISRFRLPVWIYAVSALEKTCQDLLFSFGVHPVFEPDHPTDWRRWICEQLPSVVEKGNLVILTEGPSKKHPYRNNRMEIISLRCE
jgi:pyruvate kinase